MRLFLFASTSEAAKLNWAVDTDAAPSYDRLITSQATCSCTVEEQVAHCSLSVHRWHTFQPCSHFHANVSTHAYRLIPVCLALTEQPTFQCSASPVRYSQIFGLSSHRARLAVLASFVHLICKGNASFLQPFRFSSVDVGDSLRLVASACRWLKQAAGK